MITYLYIVISMLENPSDSLVYSAYFVMIVFGEKKESLIDDIKPGDSGGFLID